jgi:hypothetical protein
VTEALPSLTEAQWTYLWDHNRPLASEIFKRLKREKQARTEPSYVQALFGPQYRFFTDPAKKKAALCSRRAGKTDALAAWLLDGGEDCPGGLSVYIALSRNNCRLILWAALERINRDHGLGLKFKEVDNQLRVEMPNGHSIWLAGCKDSAEVEKFRGPKYRRVAIDEGASYGPYLRDLVFDVLEPALLDFDGEMAIVGTPGAAPTGLFFEVTTGAGTGESAAAKWSTHTWTCRQNPHLQANKLSVEELAIEIELADGDIYTNARAEEWLHNKMESNRWDDQHPTYLREWCGVWVRDEGALVYPFNPAINSFTELPGGKWTFAIGCDVGYEDDTAFVVGAYRQGHPEIYLVHAEKWGKMIPSAVAARLEVLQRKYDAFQIIMDTGGIGKGYAEECTQRYGIGITPAKKNRKRAYIEVMRGDLLSGNIKVHKRACSVLLQEWSTLVWNEDQSEPDDRFPDHSADSALYLVRALMPYYQPKQEESELSPVQLAQRVNDAHRAKVAARLRAKAKLKSVKARHVRTFARGNEY